MQVNITSEMAQKLYYHLKRIRMVEEKIAELYPLGEMRCPTHLSIGQEAVPATIALLLQKTDFAVSTHRGHAHYLGKNGNLRQMIAELYGRESGCSRGKGGSMHLIDASVGFMGTTAIVGNSIPVGVGLAFSLKFKKTNSLSCVFFGDGAVEEGVFFESVNFAALKKLPVLFICENNLYSVYSPLSARQPMGRKIHKMVEGLGIEVDFGDGNEILEIVNKLQNAIQKIRSGNGPQFIEFMTYRWREHCGPHYDNHIGYRTQEEFEYWKNRDPIKLAEENFLKLGLMSTENFAQIEKTIEAEIIDAFEFAKSSPYPPQENAFKELFKESAS